MADPAAPPDEGATPPMNPPRQAFTIAVDIKSILLLVALVGPLATIVSLVLQVRQDVRANSLRITTAESHIEALERRMMVQERAREAYCIARRVDSVGRASPDANC